MNERITVIEPQPIVQAQIERMLQDLGYTVTEVDDQPDLAIVAFGSANEAYEETVKEWLSDDGKVPVIASVYGADTLVEVAGHETVFASLVRPFSRARLAAAIIEAGGTSDVDEAEIAVATASGSFVVDEEQVLGEAVNPVSVGAVGPGLEDVEGLVEPPMTLFGPDSGMIKTFAPALVGAAELIASSVEQLAELPAGPTRNEAVLKLLLQAGIVAIDAE